MRTTFRLALCAAVAAILFAGAASAAPSNGGATQFAPQTGFQSGVTKKAPKFKFPKKKKPTFKFPGYNGGNGGNGGGGIEILPIDPCLLNPNNCNGGGNAGNDDNGKGHDHGHHHHGFPGLHLGLGFAYDVTEVVPAGAYPAYPVACVVPPAAAAQPTLLDRVVARLVQLKELDRRGLIDDDEYEAQKTVVLVAMVPVTVAQEVGVAYALQVLKCIEEQDLISDNEYDAKRKEFVAIL